MSFADYAYRNNSPEAPSTITITQNIFQFDNSTIFFKEERFSRGQGNINQSTPSGPYDHITLSWVPVSAGSVALYKSGVLQRQLLEYSVVGNSIYLVQGAEENDEFLVRYMSFEAGDDVIFTNIEVGTLLTYNGTTLPGFLLMDGVTSYNVADYPALASYLNNNPSLVKEMDSSHFILAHISDTVYDEDQHTLVSVKKWIKY